jgi:uncharacterized protein (TIGR03437 family)
VELSGTRLLFNNVSVPIDLRVRRGSERGCSIRRGANVAGRCGGGISGQPVASRLHIRRSAPGLFTSDSSGAGPAAILNVDSVTGAVSVNSPQNPAPMGGIITAYITGAGQTNPPSTDGPVATSAGALALPVEAGMGFCIFGSSCTPVEVLYAGPAPGIVAAVTQVNMRLPGSPSASSTNTLGISVGGIWSQFSATVSVR